MAVQQDGALQRPLETAQPQQQPQEQQEQQGQQQGQGAGPDFSQLLAQQVTQAIQPVLDEFQRQVAQTIERQGGGAPGARQDGQGAQSPAQESPLAQAAAPAGQVGQAPQAVGEALRPALKTIEHDGKEWLQALLTTGLALLLADSTRAAVQQRVEQGAHTLTQKAFEAAPDGLNNQEMQAKTERALQIIIQGSLDALFAEGMRATALQGGQLAIQDSLGGDLGGAVQAVGDVLKAIVDALITALRQQWQTLVRLMVALGLLALANSLGEN